ncbi:hypothetical protein LIA77_06326 [Sarocladium implicatum]|nr:hypothetical protein LIA77_06326 [Sarocladium implicatum]
MPQVRDRDVLCLALCVPFHASRLSSLRYSILLVFPFHICAVLRKAETGFCMPVILWIEGGLLYMKMLGCVPTREGGYVSGRRMSFAQGWVLGWDRSRQAAVDGWSIRVREA